MGVVLVGCLRCLDSPCFLVCGMNAVGFSLPGGSGGAGTGSPAVISDSGSVLRVLRVLEGGLAVDLFC